jgi:metal transporter CNNM
LELQLSEFAELDQALPRELKALPPADVCAQCEQLIPPGKPAFYKMAFMAFVCVSFAALAAGLTMGLVSIESMEMEMILKSDDKDMKSAQDKAQLRDDQAAAEKVLPLLQDHHRLLVTLLLMNSLANEALPLFLDAIVPSWLAVVLSVSLVLMFGEIIPSAIFTGKSQLSMASKFASMVNCFQRLLSPVAVPIAKILDAVLGRDHKGRYNFAELRALVGIHAKISFQGESVFESVDDYGIITTKAPHTYEDDNMVIFTSNDKVMAESTKLFDDGTKYYVEPCAPSKGRNRHSTFKLYATPEKRECDLITFAAGELTSGVFRLAERDEIRIIDSVMTLTHMTVGQSGKLVPLRNCEMLDSSTDLSHENRKVILETGHSRLPVYSGHKHNVRGFILVKRLIALNESSNVGQQDIMEMVAVHPNTPMFGMLRMFQEQKKHLALVTSTPEIVQSAWRKGEEIPPDAHMMGILTLEDVIEKLIGEIEDESDGSSSGGVLLKITSLSSSPKGGSRRPSVSAESTSLTFTQKPSLPRAHTAVVPTNRTRLATDATSMSCNGTSDLLRSPLLGSADVV